MIKTSNFNPETDKKLLCTCGHSDCDKRSVQQFVLDKIQMIRESADRPLTITSGGRCPNHPDEIHRSKPADHQKCIAVDIAVNNATERGELIKLGFIYGFNAIGVAKTFVHLGIRSDKDKLKVWTY